MIWELLEDWWLFFLDRIICMIDDYVYVKYNAWDCLDWLPFYIGDIDRISTFLFGSIAVFPWPYAKRSVYRIRVPSRGAVRCTRHLEPIYGGQGGYGPVPGPPATLLVPQSSLVNERGLESVFSRSFGQGATRTQTSCCGIIEQTNSVWGRSTQRTLQVRYFVSLRPWAQRPPELGRWILLQYCFPKLPHPTCTVPVAWPCEERRGRASSWRRWPPCRIFSSAWWSNPAGTPCQRTATEQPRWNREGKISFGLPLSWSHRTGHTHHNRPHRAWYALVCT